MSANAQVAAAANTKKTIEYASAFGLSYGIDNNINGYRLTSNSVGNTFSAGSGNYNISAGYGWMVSSKWRPRVELRYTRLSYNVGGWSAATPPKEIDKSVVNMFNFDVNLRADYMFLNANKFQAYVSPAVKWEFNISREVHNSINDGTDNWRNYNDVIDENPRNLIGGSVAAIFKYNFIKQIGLTLTPEYTMFFRNFVKANDKNYSRLSVNFGVEFNFF
jgi:hypothetical protein